MRGKAGLVIGLGVGFVLGARAGRERYEQIKAAAQKVWNLEPVQVEVARAKALAKSSAMKVPRAAWNGFVKVAGAATGDGTPGQRLDATVDQAKRTARSVRKAADG